MKKIMFAAAMLLLSASSFAQDSDLLTVTPEEDNMTVSVAGFNIKLGPSTASKPSHGSGVHTSAECFSPVYLGLATIMCDRDIPGVRIPRSWNLNTDIVSFGLHGLKNNSLYFDIGIRLSYYNYRLDDGHALTINDSGIPELIDGKVFDKSKFKLTYLGMPVTLGLRVNRNFRIGATASFDMLVDARNKVKDPKAKTQLYDLNPYRTSLELSIHGHNGGLFVNYGLTSIFKESTGLDAHTLSVGIRILE